MQDRSTNTRYGFTLIELLTVVAIIAMLTALFGVGTRKIKILQRNLQQKAVFHGMEIGLELFAKDFDGYPNSGQVSDTGGVVCGAQRLAEALLGRDERGFHPRTKWHPSLDLAAPQPPYPGPDLYTEVTESNRKDPYIELKHGGVHTLAELYGSSIGTTTAYTSAGATIGTQRAPVVTDVFNYAHVTINGETEKVGLPVLYFKADSTKRFRVDETNQPALATPERYTQWVYNYSDNEPLLTANWLRDIEEAAPRAGLDVHYYEDGKSNAQVFYESLTEREEDMNNDGVKEFFKAYNTGTFILISAGYDGIYGTKDDITNFNY